MKAIAKKWMFLLAQVLAVALIVPLLGHVTTSAANGTWTVEIVCPTEGDCAEDCDVTNSYVRVPGSGAGNIPNGGTFTPPSVPFNWTVTVNGHTSQTHSQGPVLHPQQVGPVLKVDGSHLCCMQVQIPDDVAEAGGIVWIDGAGGANPLEDDECICLPRSKDIKWQLRVGGHESQWYTKHVDCTPLDAGKAELDSYCAMEIKIPGDLAEKGATVRVVGSGGGWQDEQVLYLPVSKDIQWDLTVNGHTSQLYTKHVDCTPLEVPPCAYCAMRILMPWALEEAGARVRIRGAGDQWYHGDLAYLPKSVFIEWTLIVNGKEEDISHRKHIDCTPLMAGCAPTFCEMEIVMPEALAAQGAHLRIEGLGSGHTNGEVIPLPINETIYWYLNVNNKEGPRWEKKVDCTPLTVDSSHYCGLSVRVPRDSTLQLRGDGYFQRNDVMMVPRGYSREDPFTFEYRVDGGAWQTRDVPPCGSIP